MPKLEDFEVLERIGSGSYGTCRKIRKKSDGKIYAWKEIHYGSMADVEKTMLASEVDVLRNMNHPYIVKYYGHILDKKTLTLYIITEYCKEGDLQSLIRKNRMNRTCLKEEFIWKILCQLTVALRECHDPKINGQIILHRDIKPANVFLSSKKDVKLGDFGFARILARTSDLASTRVGTPYYMSPEIISNKAYNDKSDVWSFGCLIYELCSLVPPFNASSMAQLEKKIKEGKFSRLPPSYSDELDALLRRMICVSVSRRPSIEMLMNLPILSVKYHQYNMQHHVRDENGNYQMAAKEKKLQEREKLLEKKENKLKYQKKLLDLREKLLTEQEERLDQYDRLSNHLGFQDWRTLKDHLHTKYTWNSKTFAPLPTSKPTTLAKKRVRFEIQPLQPKNQMESSGKSQFKSNHRHNEETSQMRPNCTFNDLRSSIKMASSKAFKLRLAEIESRLKDTPLL